MFESVVLQFVQVAKLFVRHKAALAGDIGDCFLVSDTGILCCVGPDCVSFGTARNDIVSEVLSLENITPYSKSALFFIALRNLKKHFPRAR